MRSLLAGLTSLPFVAGFALAAQSVPLNDTQMDAVIAGDAFDPFLLGASSTALNNLSARLNPTPTPTPTPGFTAYNGCYPDCNFPPPPPPPPPPPTPTQQFSSLLSSNGIGLR
jgi:hypothetical protein